MPIYYIFYAFFSFSVFYFSSRRDLAACRGIFPLSKYLPVNIQMCLPTGPNQPAHFTGTRGLHSTPEAGLGEVHLLFLTHFLSFQSSPLPCCAVTGLSLASHYSVRLPTELQKLMNAGEDLKYLNLTRTRSKLHPQSITNMLLAH